MFSRMRRPKVCAYIILVSLDLPRQSSITSTYTQQFPAGYKDLDTEADIWADHDPSCHGNPHDFDDDPDYAEGFKWDCCDEDATTEGCKTSKHRPDPRKRRK